MTKSLQTMDWMSPGANLNAYIQGTASVPILSLDEERAPEVRPCIIRTILRRHGV